MNKFNLNSNKLFSSLVVFLVLINIIFLTILFKEKPKISNDKTYPELSALNQSMNFSEVSAFFTNLAQKKGGRYAFQLLKVAELGPNIDLHLLGHAVGDVLYKQEGVNGITACDNDFRNACSHSIVTGVFSDKGESALPEIAAACKKAPGGIGAYTMCFHGLGHGILAFEGFDMAKGSQICQKTGTKEYGYNESSQCISGMVMEIISGGFHDRDIWAAQRVKYLNVNKPLALCQSSFIPSQAQFLCYDYLTPFLFEAAGADPGMPTARDFETAFKFCDLIPKNEVSNRDSCFGGFGKEFDGLVQGRDIRQGSVNSMSDDKLKQISTWCMLAPNKDGSKSCIVNALSSLYWGGENNKQISVNFCSLVSDPDLQSACFSSLISDVSYYMKDVDYRKDFCSKLPDKYTSNCNKTLII